MIFRHTFFHGGKNPERIAESGSMPSHFSLYDSATSGHSPLSIFQSYTRGVLQNMSFTLDSLCIPDINAKEPNKLRCCQAFGDTFYTTVDEHGCRRTYGLTMPLKAVPATSTQL